MWLQRHDFMRFHLISQPFLEHLRQVDLSMRSLRVGTASYSVVLIRLKLSICVYMCMRV